MARNTMQKGFSLKDELFNRDSVGYLGTLLERGDSSFNKEKFVKEVISQFPKLELKERIIWIAEVLEKNLPTDFKKAAKHIRSVLPPPLDPAKTDNDFGSFIIAPFGEFVVRNGLEKELVMESLDTLLELTQRFSMEDAIRPFINTFKKETMARLEKWTKHPHYHVRRLVSEGTRPLLPWSRRITLSPKDAIPFLDVLYSDKARYVTRSVANHINDIAKRDPALAVATLAKWKKEGKQEKEEMEWMMRHALRTLVKRGNKDALLLLGHSPKAKVTVERFTLKSASRKISPGEALSFSCVLKASNDEHVILDYVVDFMKANGNSKGKVFKIKKLHLKKGEKILIEKRHRFVKDATTFKLYPGRHSITLLINGVRSGTKEFFIL